MANLSGKEIGKYRITERIGHGGMAEVYKGVHTHLDREVAIKVLHGYLLEGGDFLARFKREAKAVANLRHPNIVQVYDFDIQDDIIFMVMEYIDGTDLQSKLVELDNKGEHLSIKQIGSIIKDIASALDYAHSQGMLHRDVKPSNILLDKNGKAYLTDFGIARLLSDQKLTATGTLIGTPAYMSPEQGKGEEVSRESDIYSLGVVAFELLTGQVPYDAQTPIAIVQKQIADPIPDLRAFVQDVPESAQEVIETALAKAPEQRYPSAEALVIALRGALEALEGADASLKITAAPVKDEDRALYSATVAMEDSTASAEVDKATVLMEDEGEKETETSARTLDAEAPPMPGIRSGRKLPTWGYLAGGVGLVAIAAVALSQVLGGKQAAAVPTGEPSAAVAASEPSPGAGASAEEPTEASAAYDGPRALVTMPGAAVGMWVFNPGGGDADVEVIEVDGQPAWHTGSASVIANVNGDTAPDSYMKVAVGDEVMFEGQPTTQVQIEIVYLDQGRDWFRLEYDALAGGPYGDGTFKDTDWFEKTDSGEFRTAVFQIDDAYFGNRIQEADFRLNDNSDGAETIRSIGLTLLGLPGDTPAATGEDVLALAEEAQRLRDAGDIEGALELTEQALATEPTNPDLNTLKGMILWQDRKDRQAAEDAFNLAVAYAAPDMPHVYNARGLFYLETDRCELAVVDYTSALASDPANPFLHLERGQCYARLDEVEPARADFLDFMELSSGDMAFDTARQEVEAWLGSH